ncbi:MAG: VCBS repeat-containing protein, partial [Fulvivirga sp.]
DELGLAITSEFMTTGVSVGDIDNDGDPDLFVSTWIGAVGNTFKRNLLFVNDHGTGHFEEKGLESGLLEESWSMGATMTDVNLDGHLDIYVVNYVRAHGNIELDNNGEVSFYQPDCFPNFLYLNNRDGTFTEVSEEYQVANDGGCSLAAAFTDYDNDQKPDLLVANDFGWWATPNQLYKNIGASYLDVSESSNMNLPMFGMGIAIGDYDEDEDLDYYVTNIRGNSLFTNNGDTTFIDKAESAGVSNVYTGDNFTTGWGAVFYDFDNDTKLDLALTNGYVATEPIIYTAYQDEDKLYKNKGDGTFEDVSAEIGFNSNEISKGLIIGDYDNDGDLDAFVVVAKSNESIDPHYLLYEKQNTK